MASGIKGELNLKSRLSYLKERIKCQSKLSFSFWLPCFHFEIFQFLSYLHIWRSLCGITYRGMLYIFTFIKRNLFEVIMCVCFSNDTKHVGSLGFEQQAKVWHCILRIYCFSTSPSAVSSAEGAVTLMISVTLEDYAGDCLMQVQYKITPCRMAYLSLKV